MKAKKISVVILLVLFAAIIFLKLLPRIPAENEILVLILNTVFTCLIPIGFSCLAAKTYLKNSISSALYLCCGMLIFGLGSICAAILLNPLDVSVNVSVTVYNICAFAAAFFCMLSSRFDDKTSRKHTKLILSGAVSGIVVLLLVTIYSALRGVTPPFMDENGFTAIRYLILNLAIVHFAFTGCYYYRQYRRARNDSLFWYSLSLWMIALGLFGVCIASDVGTLLGWTGRIALYTGSVYALFAIITMRRDAQSRNAETADIMAEFFSDSEGNYKSLVNSSPSAVISIDKDFNIFTANPSAMALLKTALTNDAEKSFPDYLKEPYKSRVKEDLTSYILTGASSLIDNTLEMEAIDTEGLCFPVEISFSSRKLAHNVAITLILHDITERRMIELSLKQSEQNALALVEELKKSGENKNHFISILSHELRNPLAVITASLSLLDITDVSPETEETRDVLHRQTGHLKKLVDDLLDLTRITNNKIKLKKEIIDINDIASKVIKDYAAQFADKGIRLSGDFCKGHLFIDADPLRLSQLLSNLLNNALNFTESGKNVGLSVYKEDSAVVLKLKDDGIGIDPSVLPSIFEAFVQAHNPFTQTNNGLGLGLAIAKTIVDLHGGVITAYSEGAGKGSVFTVSLPLVDLTQDLSRSTEVRRTPARPLKILIIDDNKDYAAMSSKLLEYKGYESRYATGALDGIQVSKEFNPDVILCDIGLPGIDGYEVARMIRREDFLKDVSLIAVTGFAGAADMLLTKDAGFDLHLAKPLDYSQLEQALSSIRK